MRPDKSERGERQYIDLFRHRRNLMRTMSRIFFVVARLTMRLRSTAARQGGSEDAKSLCGAMSHRRDCVSGGG
jgi:hypothetical protein